MSDKELNVPRTRKTREQHSLPSHDHAAMWLVKIGLNLTKRLSQICKVQQSPYEMYIDSVYSRSM